MMTNSEILRTAEKELTTTQRELQNVQEFTATVKQAIEQFITKKYASLTKAIKSHGGDFEQVRNAYGYGFISKRTFNKLSALQSEKECDVTSRLTDEVIKMLSGREVELTRHIENLQRVIADIKSKEE